MRQGKAKYLFPGNNTPKGFISHYHEGLRGMQQIFILKGGPGVGKSTLMRKIGTAMLERGYDVEFWQCSSDNDSIDGVLIPAISTAIIDGTSPHIVDPRYPGAVEEIVNLGNHWNRLLLRNDKKDIIELTDSISEHFTACYAKLAKAGSLLESQMKKTASKIDMPTLRNIIQELTNTVYRSGASRSRNLFSTAVTPRGLISFAEPLSRSVGNRWLLIGPVGCGKELILKSLADEAERKGHYAEIYHPALLPEQIELLLLPDLDIAILDAGDKTPSYATDEDHIIDCSELCDIDSEQIEKENGAIATLVEEATAQVAKAKELHDKLEQHYIRAMNFEEVDAAGSTLFNRILALCAEKESGGN